MKKLTSARKAKSGSSVTGSFSNHYFESVTTRKPVTLLLGMAVIVILAVVVPVAVYRSLAATGSVALEAESGSFAGAAALGSDNNASAGSYIAFGGAGSGGGTNVGEDNTCKSYSTTNFTPAFCDSFSTPTPYDVRFARSGDLNGLIWGVSRTSSLLSGNNTSLWGTSHIDGCGSTADVNNPNDVRICNGRVYEVNNDEETQTTLAMYPKQPFNFADGTGTVVFDASTDTHGGHGAWPEFWITDQPIPAPHGDTVSGQGHYIRNGVGFSLRIDKCGGPTTQVGVDEIDVIRNYSDRETWGWIADQRPPGHSYNAGCVTKSTGADANLNHFEFKIENNSVKIYGTNPGSTQLVLLAEADNVNLSFTQGLVWMNDVHYNAEKDDYPVHQHIHTFAWDNLGFDGPKTYRDLAYDIPDRCNALNINPNASNFCNGLGSGDVGPGIFTGYTFNNSTQTFTTPNVTWPQQPGSAIVTFDWGPTWDRRFPTVSVNGGPFHQWCEPNCATLPAWPFQGGDEDPEYYRAIAIPIPLSEIHQGTNTLAFKYDLTNASVVPGLMNINLIMVNAAPVP